MEILDLVEYASGIGRIVGLVEHHLLDEMPDFWIGIASRNRAVLGAEVHRVKDGAADELLDLCPGTSCANANASNLVERIQVSGKSYKVLPQTTKDLSKKIYSRGLPVCILHIRN